MWMITLYPWFIFMFASLCRVDDAEGISIDRPGAEFVDDVAAIADDAVRAAPAAPDDRAFAADGEQVVANVRRKACWRQNASTRKMMKLVASVEAKRKRELRWKSWPSRRSQGSHHSVSMLNLTMGRPATRR